VQEFLGRRILIETFRPYRSFQATTTANAQFLAALAQQGRLRSVTDIKQRFCERSITL